MTKGPLENGIGIFLGICVFIGLVVLGTFPTRWMVDYVFTPSALSLLFGGPLTFWKALWINLFVAGFGGARSK